MLLPGDSKSSKKKFYFVSIFGNLHPMEFWEIFCLFFRFSCCLQNTDKSYAFAKQLHEQYSDAHITQDHLIFLSALAIDQGAPHVAIEILNTQLWPTAHQAIPSLRLNALMQMQKFLDALQIMRTILVVFDNNRSPKNEVIAIDVVSFGQ